MADGKAVGLVWIARPQLCQHPPRRGVHFEQGNHIGVDPLDFRADPVCIFIEPECVEARHPQRPLAISQGCEHAWAAALDMRPGANRHQPGQNQQQGHRQPGAPKQQADAEGRGDEREMQRELREDVETDPEMPGPGQDEARDTQQHAKPAFDCTRSTTAFAPHPQVWLSLAGQHLPVSRLGHVHSGSGQSSLLSMGRICSGAPKPGSASKRFFQAVTLG